MRSDGRTNSSSNAAARAVQREMQESPIFSSGARNGARPSHDPQRQFPGDFLATFSMVPRIVIGYVTDAVSLAHCYRVFLDAAMPPIVACYMARSGLSVSGPREHNTLQPGQMVLVLIHPHLQYGVILGPLPSVTTSSKQAGLGQLTFASRQRVDDAHAAVFDLLDKGSVINFSAGRPRDGLMAGEIGWTTELGSTIHLDSAMAIFAINEATGVFGFRRDSLLRVAGVNLQLWSGCTEAERLLDQEECHIYEGFATYPWEQLGRFGREAAFEKNSAQKWQIDEPHYGKVEPKDDRIMPWHRVRHFYGYLGWGAASLLQSPPRDYFESDTVAYEGGSGLEEPDFPSMASDHTTLDGRRIITSARAWSIGKRLAGLSPHRKRRPEQGGGLGDDETNYMASGKVGAGPPHDIKDGPEASGDDPLAQKIAGRLDAAAYSHNFLLHHPCIFHVKDWYVGDEPELEYTEGTTLKIPEFDKLKDRRQLDPPEPIKLEIDHKLKNQDYYQTESVIEGLEDGTIRQVDGYFSQMLSSRGCITQTAAGDIVLRAGRNIILSAGGDVVIRARQSIDVSATEKDVRIKAEKNLGILAGNGGEGGVHIESRATGPVYDHEKPGEDTKSSGIVLKAPKSEVVSLAKNIYLRTGSDGGEVETGDIVLDADQGRGRLTTHSKGVTNYVDGVFNVYFGTEGNVRTGHELGETTVTIAAPTMNFVGLAVMVGGAVMKGGILIAAGHIATELAQGTNCKVDVLEAEALARVYEIAATAEQRAETGLPQQGEEEYEDRLEQPFYEDGKIGNAGVIRDAQFSLRTVEQYGTTDFEQAEDPWQQLARLGNIATEKWEEKPVDFKGTPTYPYPGRENYEGDKYAQQDLDLWEFRGRDGSAKRRGPGDALSAAYKQPRYKAPVKKKLSEFTVIQGA